MHHLFELLIPAAQAHETWFVADTGAANAPAFYRTFNAWTVGAFAVVLAFIIGGVVVDRLFERSPMQGRLDKAVSRFQKYAAGVLAVTTGLTLVWMGAHGWLLAPNFVIPANDLLFMAGAEVVVGLLLLVGLYTPAASFGLVLLYGAAVGMFGAVDALDYFHYFGIGVFLLAFSRGTYSLDWLLGKDLVSRPQERRLAYLALRVISGATLVWLAFGKWWRPELHLKLLQAYPDLNPYVILHWLHIALTPEHYVFLLFVAELLVGIAVLCGFVTRIAALVLAPVFVGSVIFLGAPELMGHLPIIGILAVLFVFGDTYHKEKGEDALGKRRTARQHQRGT